MYTLMNDQFAHEDMYVDLYNIHHWATIAILYYIYICVHNSISLMSPRRNHFFRQETIINYILTI